MIAIDPPVRILIFSLASEGPSTHAPRRRIAASAEAIHWLMENELRAVNRSVK